jgi:hypothetical protein
MNSNVDHRMQARAGHERAPLREGMGTGARGDAPKILLIEDNPDHAFFERQALERELGAEVTTEPRPEDGLRRLREHDYDAVVLDYNLPGEDGLDVLKRIKSASADLPVILITAFGSEEVAVEAMKEGASDYIVKRFGSTAQDLRLAAAVRKSLQQAELARAYRRTQEMLRTTLELAWDGVGYLNLASGRMIFANEAFCRMLGYARTELEGRAVGDLLVPEERGRLDALLERLRRRGGPAAPGAAESGGNGAVSGGALAEMELRLAPRDGRSLLVDLRTTEVDLGGERCVLLAARDITEKKRLAEHLVQAQKMEAVGRLAGGIAHDFNNLLGAILGYASYLKRHVEPDDRRFKSVETIEAAAERAADLVQRLLSFARRGPADATPFSPNAMLEEMIRLVARSIPENVRIEKSLALGLPAVEGDETQLQQAILNICLNARDAMPGGGVLSVETARAGPEDLPAALAAASGPGAVRKGGEYVLVRVRDTGVGMTADVRARIFEPFFTTKARGKGTGLGLASAYAIVKSHGGEIEVTSEPGKGTEFRVFLPASEREPAPERRDPALEGGVRGTVLVVDDEPSIRALTHDLLTDLGCDVVLAGSGPEALERYAELRGRIDLVVLDIVMPGMNGLETFRRLRRIDSEARVLVASGYSPEGMAADALREGALGFIHKPFRAAELASSVKAAIRAAPPT